MTWLAYSHLGVAKRLTLDTQPGGALAGIPFVSQPVGRLLDGSGVLSRTTGTVVTVSKLSGVGTLSGTLTAVTVEGVFTFTDLKMDTVTGTVVLQFTAPGLVSVDSTSFNVTQPNTIIGCEVGSYAVTGTAQTLTRGPYMLRQDTVGSYAITGTAATLTGPTAAWLGNKPANYTTVVNDFGWSTDPTLSPGDHVIGGGWSCIYGDQFSPSPTWTTTLVSDATEPVSPPYCFQWQYVANTKSGYGTPYLTNTFAGSEIYVAFTIWHDSNFEWNTTSNKMLVINPGNMYFQSRHDAANWWQVSFLDLPATYNANLAVGTIPTGRWVNVEFIMKRHATLGEIHWWTDGVKIGEYTGINVPFAGSANDLSLPSTWGGATPNTTRDSYRRIGHIHIATP